MFDQMRMKTFVWIGFCFLDEALGPALFTVKGNQGKGWKPVQVRYLGTATIKVNIRTPKVSVYMFVCS